MDVPAPQRDLRRMADPTDPYKILQVDPEADPEVIQAAYRRLAQKYHPDVMSDGSAAARMVAINQAWAILRDPESRAALDRERAVVKDVPRSSGVPRPAGAPRHAPEPTSGDWSSGRSATGSGYDPATMGAREGLGAAGPPPGAPSGSVIPFGRYAGWSLGEIARRDVDYIEWLDRMPIGRPYRDEIDALLRQAGRRRTAQAEAKERRGLFRRR
jgi:curved DNA-binding protein CbpA